MLRYSIHCQALNFFDMIISERLCRLERSAIREIRDVVQLCRNRWGSTKYEKLERIYASFFYCSLLLSSQKLVNLTLTNDFFFYSLPKNCESCTCKIPAKSTTTNCQRFSTLLRGYSVSEFNNQVVFEVLIKLCFLPSHDDVLGRKQIVSNWLPTIRVI